MPWTVEFHEEFAEEFHGLSDGVKDALVERVRMLELDGPMLARPFADTLKDSSHANMKELRFDADGGVWRVAFAFDPQRQAILLIGGDKRGADQKRFYRGLVRKADQRFDAHLATLKK